MNLNSEELDNMHSIHFCSCCRLMLLVQQHPPSVVPQVGPSGLTPGEMQGVGHIVRAANLSFAMGAPRQHGHGRR